MSNIKQTFTNWRENTPKRVQWLLLAAAFVLVIILLTLLLMGRDDAQNELVDDIPTNLMFNPQNMEINWANIIVGETEHQSVTVTANKPVKIINISNPNIPGLTMTSGCVQIGTIDPNIPCTINLDYAPTTEKAVQPVSIDIQWHNADKPDSMSNITTYSIILGAENPPEPEPEPIVIEKVIEKIVEPEPEPELEPEPPVIAPPPFEEPVPVNEEPSEACSEFSFPGYGTTGNQIGWIKPKGGAYYFYPFSDKNCENPTGVYNPDNGFIMDIKSKSKKIGSDADHIGYAAITGGALPQLTTRGGATATTDVSTREDKRDKKAITMGRLGMVGDDDNAGTSASWTSMGGLRRTNTDVSYESSATEGDIVVSSQIYDRQFLLRQYKPIPATIVSDVRADPEALANGVPVRATVDRNVYSDNGRNVIIPTGTMMLGYVAGETLPGPYKAIGRMQIKWYQFILPNGVEFNFTGDGDKDPFSADSQGRVGVPGRGSTDYLEQFFMPMLTAIVPAAVNLIAPVTDAFVNQIDLDNNTVVQSGTVRSSELAKNEIITAWNQVAQKLLVDMMDNTVPPFTIAAGTRITVYSPVDLMVTCGDRNSSNKKCAVAAYGDNKRRSSPMAEQVYEFNPDDPSMIGQVRSFKVNECCEKGKVKDPLPKVCEAYDYRTLVFYCQSEQYKAINNARQDALYQNQQALFKHQYGTDSQFETDTGLTGIQGSQKYNEQVLGLEYENGVIKNPFEDEKDVSNNGTATLLTCEDGILPDENGCCPGEIFTDMGDQGSNCCPETGGDCFPPLL